jgi:5-enolpyruvylshikimate-3-phosphate synthase
MSLAVAASAATDTVTIRDVDAVATSFPGFCERMTSLGVDIHSGGERPE